MLHAPLNRLLLVAAAMARFTVAPAQVAVDAALHLTAPLDERRIDGLAHPVSGDGATPVMVSVASGGFTWCLAGLELDTLLLAADPPVTEYREGLLLRFICPADLSGSLHVRGAPQLPAVPLLRPDGLVPAAGQLRAGSVCEVVHHDGRFTLLNAPDRGCPPGFLPATERLCMEQAPATGMLFHDAVQRCANLGGRLCAWDEYIVGCNLLGADLLGMFQQWEWIDGSSDHTHGADQAGRDLCTSHRMMGNLATQVANTRCCYHPR